MCIAGNGGFFSKLLSSKVLIPLSRATYSIDLTHVWIVWTFWASKRELVDMRSYQMVLLFFGVITMSFIVGVLFSLLFESPLFILQKHLKQYLLGGDRNNNKSYITPSDLSETVNTHL